MKTTIAVLWDRLRSSFWFVPMLMMLGAAMLSFATVAFDGSYSDGWERRVGWIYAGGGEGASGVLQTVAGSMITIAALVFSLTLLTLAQTSSQFGPRLLRTFMRDTTNQVVLGTFVATFVYCLLVLRTIRRVEEAAFVPHLSVTIGVVLGVVSLAVLIYFIHHVALSIQADEIAARVATELMHGIDRMFPAALGGSDAHVPTTAEAAIPADLESTARPLNAKRDGYVQVIDSDRLMELVTQKDLFVRIERRPGHYVVDGRPLALVWPGAALDEDLEGELHSIFVVGKQRTESQDVEFAVTQLVEIAVRALSPGINDPFTAVACVDRLGSALVRLAEREIPSPYRFDEAGRLRVLASPFSFEGIVDAAFNAIRQYGRTSAAVTIRLLEVIATIAPSLRRPGDATALRRHADMIIRGGREALPEENDRLAVESRYEEACRALAHPVAPSNP